MLRSCVNKLSGPSRRIGQRMLYEGDSLDYDIIVSGGSIVGSAFVSKIMQSEETSNLRIGIVDMIHAPLLESCLKKGNDSIDIRVYALSPSSISFLDDIGAWKHIEPRSQSYSEMQIWDRSGPGLVKFSANEMRVPELGRIVEDSTVLASIRQSIIEKQQDAATNNNKVARLDDLTGWKIKSLDLPREMEMTGKAAVVTVTDGTKTKSLTAKLVIGADGANSTVRKCAGISSWGWGYGQEAIVATVKVSTPHETAWQRYLPTGPIALLPLWGGYSSVVWSLPSQEASRLKSLSKEEFLIELRSALEGMPDSFMVASDNTTSSSGLEAAMHDQFSRVHSHLENSPVGHLMPSQQTAKMAFQRATGLLGHLGALGNKIHKELRAVAETTIASSQMSGTAYTSPPSITDISSKVVSFPLQFQQAKNYVASRVALAGDAAHSIHPQAGQGLNLGIGDAEALAACVIRGMENGSGVGTLASLEPYHKSQYARNLVVMGGVDTINRIYSSDLQSVKFLRSLGMLGFNASGPLKSKISQAAGVAIGRR